MSSDDRYPAGPSLKTTKRLFALSGNRCAFPKCRVELVQVEANLGELCHIKAANRSGPRYDSLQSPSERHDFSNLLLLCANHHKVVDDDETSYTVERLREMKYAHEAGARSMSDDDAGAGATLILSVGQSGGIVAGTLHAQTIHIHAGTQNTNDSTFDDAALALFAPELARILARQVYVLDRSVVNFVCASVVNPQPPDHWTTFKPWKPRAYQSAPAFRDLAPADAALLTEFFEGLTEIDDLIESWRESETTWDVNVWNLLMQKIERSLVTGLRAAERFCPNRQYDTTMPASGTLVDRAAASASGMRAALDAHIARHTSISARNATRV